MALDQMKQRGRGIKVAGRALLVVAATLIVFPLLGINIFTALPALYRGTLGNPYSLSQTLTVTAVITLTAAAALIPFRAGFVNLGGEGQLVAGAAAMSCIVLTIGEPGSLWVAILGMIAAIVGGALWAGIASWLHERFGANEVITTLMLNFVAFAVADFIWSTVWPDKIAPQTKNFPDATSFPSFGKFEQTPWAVLFALAAWALSWWLIQRTNFGFRIRATGENPLASFRFGYQPVRTRVLAVLLGGGMAGLAGGVLAMFVTRALLQGISQSYGYVGIAAALLIALRPALLPIGAIAFAVISVGGNTLAAVSKVSPSVSLVGVSVCVLMLLATRPRPKGSRG
jgi:simple sugar transport system permease protein